MLSWLYANARRHFRWRRCSRGSCSGANPTAGAKVQPRNLERGWNCAAVSLVLRFVVCAREGVKVLAAIASGANRSTRIEIQFPRYNPQRM